MSQSKNKHHKTLFEALLAVGGLIALLVFAFFASSPVLAEDDVNDLNDQINEKRIEIKELEDKKGAIEQELVSKQSEVSTINGQLDVIDNQISVTNININSAEVEIEKINLEMDQLQQRIGDKEEIIKSRQEDLAELIRLMYREQNKSNLEIVLSDDTFAEFFSRLKNTGDIENQTKKEVVRLNTLKHELEIQFEDLDGKQEELKENNNRLHQQQIALVDQQSYQETLLGEAVKVKGQVQVIAEDLQKQVNQANIEISSLERNLRRKLFDSGEGFSLEFGGTLIWPVNPVQGISAYFHDPSYPYRNIFEHNAIDIPTGHGTPVVTAADGIIAVARNLDWTSCSYGPCPAYNYVSIIHGVELSTTYGHLSVVYVSEGDMVKQGEVIGLSGGTPGTSGAGLLTTGAHLHFEVKEFNAAGYPIAVDPLLYLP